MKVLNLKSRVFFALINILILIYCLLWILKSTWLFDLTTMALGLESNSTSTFRRCDVARYRDEVLWAEEREEQGYVHALLPSHSSKLALSVESPKLIRVKIFLNRKFSHWQITHTSFFPFSLTLNNIYFFFK